MNPNESPVWLIALLNKTVKMLSYFKKGDANEKKF
jgi:hypothetical protein